ncbi:hypothetical protein FB451DRAFT_1189478 [Mycena latifolia]|nr:hypothetical protein FB451DRAFT_1189478 [Mycena latifolia]
MKESRLWWWTVRTARASVPSFAAPVKKCSRSYDYDSGPGDAATRCAAAEGSVTTVGGTWCFGAAADKEKLQWENLARYPVQNPDEVQIIERISAVLARVLFPLRQDARRSAISAEMQAGRVVVEGWARREGRAPYAPCKFRAPHVDAVCATRDGASREVRDVASLEGAGRESDCACSGLRRMQAPLMLVEGRRASLGARTVCTIPAALGRCASASRQKAREESRTARVPQVEANAGEAGSNPGREQRVGWAHRIRGGSFALRTYALACGATQQRACHSLVLVGGARAHLRGRAPAHRSREFAAKTSAARNGVRYSKVSAFRRAFPQRGNRTVPLSPEQKSQQEESPCKTQEFAVGGEDNCSWKISSADTEELLARADA